MGDQEIIKQDLASILAKSQSYIDLSKRILKKDVFVDMMSLEAKVNKTKDEEAELRELKLINLEMTKDIEAKELFVKNYEYHVKQDIEKNELDIADFMKYSEQYIKDIKEYVKSSLITLEQKRTLKGMILEYANAKEYNAWSMADYWRMLKSMKEMIGNYLLFRRNKDKIPVYKIEKPM